MNGRIEIFFGAEEFEWDSANLDKNWDKHKVAHFECEEVFFNKPLVVSPDIKHSSHEARFYALGKTNRNRFLFVVFTVKNKKLRVISARDMSKKERKWYQ
ncbi:MAG: BrnT family toxin [Candidatus Margulisbacteria bacterium]|nr:BrnT family toxin [Candidatus Margulisiibacteriota bacterium]